MIVSVGALSDEALCNLVRDEAAQSRAQVHLPAGALLGIDGLSAAKWAGLDWVRLTSRKSPLAWSGAPGVEHYRPQCRSHRGSYFLRLCTRGRRPFPSPKNANVAATVALAGIGFEETTVELIADPAAERISHLLEFEGRPGRFQVETQGLPSPDNPKTSMLTAYNIYSVDPEPGCFDSDLTLTMGCQGLETEFWALSAVICPPPERRRERKRLSSLAF